MLNHKVAIEALEAIAAFTGGVQGVLDSRPINQKSRLEELGTLQIINSSVFTLLTRVKQSPEWRHELQQEVLFFLRQECEDQAILSKKLGHLYAVGERLDLFRYIQRNLFSKLTDIRPVSFLWSDMHGFNAADYPLYRTIVDPVIYAHSHLLTIDKLGKTDSLAAYSEALDGEHLLVNFAKGLRLEFLKSRKSVGMPDSVGIGIGIAKGTCSFNQLSGRPEPSPDCAWTQAAKSMYTAERLCKYFHTAGGVILVSDNLRDIFKNECKQLNLRDIDSSLGDGEVNMLQ